MATETETKIHLLREFGFSRYTKTETLGRWVEELYRDRDRDTDRDKDTLVAKIKKLVLKVI